MTPNDPMLETYTGFLMIRCEHCGEVRGFRARYPLSYHKCRACGGKTMLYKLRRMTARCAACGNVWRYQTNLNEALAEISCLACDAPITMERGRSGAYKTIMRG